MTKRADELEKALEGLEVDLDVLMAEVSFGTDPSVLQSQENSRSDSGNPFEQSKEKHIGVGQPAQIKDNSQVRMASSQGLKESSASVSIAEETLAEASANSTFEESLGKSLLSVEKEQQEDQFQRVALPPIVAKKDSESETILSATKARPNVSIDEMAGFVYPDAAQSKPRVPIGKKSKNKIASFLIVGLSFLSGSLLSVGGTLYYLKPNSGLNSLLDGVDEGHLMSFIQAYNQSPEPVMSAITSVSLQTSGLISTNDHVALGEEVPILAASAPSNPPDPPALSVEPLEPTQSIVESSSSESQPSSEINSDKKDSTDNSEGESALTQPAALYCYKTEENEIGLLKNKIQKVGLSPKSKINYIETSKVLNYYVAMSPAGQKKNSASDIRLKGVKETFLIKEGKHAGFLSLGLFSSRAAASRYASHLGSLGLSHLNILPNKKNITYYAAVKSDQPIALAGWIEPIKCKE